jgi:hypothetical protein
VPRARGPGQRRSAHAGETCKGLGETITENPGKSEKFHEHRLKMTNKNDLACSKEPLKYEEQKRKVSIKSVSKNQSVKVPSNWHELKLKRIEIQKSKEPRTLLSITEPHACEEKRMVLTKPSEREIKDPTVRECELQFNKSLVSQKRNPDFSESRLFRAFSKDYQYVEYPKDSVKVTTSTPKIEWGMNKKSCMNVFYRYREVKMVTIVDF